MFRIIVALVVIAAVAAFAPTRMMNRRTEVSMSIEDVQSKIGKALGIAAMGIALAGPVPAMADGAASASSVYRARVKYGPTLTALGAAASKGDFAAFENKKAINSFDLFISGTNSRGGVVDKDRKKAEKAILSNIYSAVKAKDSGKLKAAYDDFYKVADLKSDYKPGELGQTDSSGYSPTWGTPQQYIYQR